MRSHPVLQQEFALLCRAASWTGGIANQNRGTLGGNIVNASPAADSAPALLVYDAQLELRSINGARRVPYHEFHTGYKTMNLNSGELLSRVLLPRRPGPVIEYGRKVGTRKAQAITKTGLAAIARMTGDTVEEVRVAVSSMAPVPLRCWGAERAIAGSIVSPDVRTRAMHALAEEIAPIDDLRSTKEYRRRVALNLFSEFLELLVPGDPLTRWNVSSADEAEALLLRCCGSHTWATRLVAMRPLSSVDELFDVADRIWWDLDREDWLEAFRDHPRIGDSVRSTTEAREQSGMKAAGNDIRERMVSGNREYEVRFGHIYIVCATGKTGEEMLAILNDRLGNSHEAELREAAEQQRQITRLRLERWLRE